MFTRKPVLDKALRRRVAVNSIDTGSTLFVGRLAEFDKDTYVLESCQTAGENPVNLPGRQYIDRVHAFLTEHLT